MVEPEPGRPLSELGVVRGVLVRPGRVEVSLALVVSGHPHADRIRNDVTETVQALGGGEVVVDLTAMNDQDRARVRHHLQGERPDPSAVFDHTRVFAVASENGGVGKPSVAANLAVAMGCGVSGSP